VINNSNKAILVGMAVPNNVINAVFWLMCHYHVDIFSNFNAIRLQIVIILISNVYKCVIK